MLISIRLLPVVNEYTAYTIYIQNNISGVLGSEALRKCYARYVQMKTNKFIESDTLIWYAIKRRCLRITTEYILYD